MLSHNRANDAYAGSNAYTRPFAPTRTAAISENGPTFAPMSKTTSPGWTCESSHATVHGSRSHARARYLRSKSFVAYRRSDAGAYLSSTIDGPAPADPPAPEKPRGSAFGLRPLAWPAGSFTSVIGPFPAPGSLPPSSAASLADAADLHQRSRSRDEARSEER